MIALVQQIVTYSLMEMEQNQLESYMIWYRMELNSKVIHKMNQVLFTTTLLLLIHQA